MQNTSLYDISGVPILLNKAKVTTFWLKYAMQDQSNWSELSPDALVCGS